MAEKIEKGISLWSDAFQRLKKNRAAVVSLFLLAIIMSSCIILPMIPGFLIDPNLQNLMLENLSPSSAHYFGTDHLGRDIFSRLMFGGRISIAVGLITTMVSVFIGVIWGALAGYVNRKLDALMMRIVDILFAMPFLIVVILLRTVLEPKTTQLTDWVVNLIVTDGASVERINTVRTAVEPLCSLIPLFIAIGMLSWLTISRIVRAQVQTVKKLEYVEAARSLGLGNVAILFRHILPNSIGPIVVYTTLTIPSVMLFEAVLSFLGMGVKPPNSSWGVLIEEGASRMFSNPMQLVFPSVFFSLTLLSLNFLGDGLRDALDPKSSKD
jgi:oligopeptide transport system permease protein